MASINKLQTKSFWSTHIGQWHSSGLSQAAYCRQHDLCEQKFSYRKRQSSFGKEKTQSSTGFLRVQVDTPVHSSSTRGLSIRFNSGIRIEGITDSNLTLVQSLFAVLG